jgi:hypothetical protein
MKAAVTPYDSQQMQGLLAGKAVADVIIVGHFSCISTAVCKLNLSVLGINNNIMLQ